MMNAGANLSKFNYYRIMNWDFSSLEGGIFYSLKAPFYRSQTQSVYNAVLKVHFENRVKPKTRYTKAEKDFYITCFLKERLYK